MRSLSRSITPSPLAYPMYSSRSDVACIASTSTLSNCCSFPYPIRIVLSGKTLPNPLFSMPTQIRPSLLSAMAFTQYRSSASTEVLFPILNGTHSPDSCMYRCSPFSPPIHTRLLESMKTLHIAPNSSKLTTLHFCLSQS